MDRISVVSSNIRNVGYDPEDEILEIEFLSGGLYRYFDVPVEVHGGLMWADSPGGYFAEWIRDRYEFERLR